MMKKMEINQIINGFELMDINGVKMNVPQLGKLVHLQFRRFSGCPICSIHMGQMKNRKADIDAAGVVEIIFFYSDEKDMKENLKGIPFHFIADPKRHWYEKFGVETSLKSVLNPLAWPHAMKGFVLNIGRFFSLLPKNNESMFGLPAEFLINENGVILDLKYGTHGYDQWSVYELLQKAKAII